MSSEGGVRRRGGKGMDKVWKRGVDNVGVLHKIGVKDPMPTMFYASENFFGMLKLHKVLF